MSRVSVGFVYIDQGRVCQVKCGVLNGRVGTTFLWNFVEQEGSFSSHRM